MKTIISALAIGIVLAGAVRADMPPSPAKAEGAALRTSVREDKVRLKRVGEDQHKELVLVREREKSDLALTKASAARGETLHAAILDVHERSRRLRLALRERGSAERRRLRRALKDARERIAALRRKK
jgi:hypothetical protein